MQAYIPSNWVKTELDNLGDILTGKTPSTKDQDNFHGEIPFIKPGDLYSGGYIHTTSETLSKKGGSNVPLLPENSILVTCIGNIGKVGITTKRSAFNQQINALIPTSIINHKYAYHYICTLKNWFENESSSTTIPIINKGRFSKAPILLPSQAEQKEIADRLDKLLAQVEETQARLARIPDIIKQFRQSVLAAAVSGKLTKDWIEQNEIHESARDLKNRWIKERGDWFNATQQELVNAGKIKKIKPMKSPVSPDMDTAIPDSIPEHWIFISVDEFSQCLDNMRIPVKKDARSTDIGLYPYFGANGEVDRVDEYIFDDDLVLVTEDETFYGREKPIAYRYTGKCWVNNHVHVLKAMTKEANDYLCYALMYYKVIPWLSGTTGRAKLTQAALNSLPIGLPPYNELVEIVRRVEQLFAYADSIEQQAKAAKERVDNLTQAILAKAFRGELTADWRAANPDLISGDNSAAALLARIQAERAQSAKKGRKRTQPAP